MEFLEGIPLGKEIGNFLAAAGALAVAAFAYYQGKKSKKDAPK